MRVSLGPKLEKHSIVNVTVLELTVNIDLMSLANIPVVDTI